MRSGGACVILSKINELVWGVPALVLLLGTGVYLTAQTGFVQIRLLLPSLKTFIRQLKGGEDTNGTTPFRALCTALAATVGTGNIAGVAGAIAIGGPGAVFWMWVSGFVGMATKYAEAALAVRYREKNAKGETVGGPMFIIQKGLGKGWAPLAVVYSAFGIIAALGIGNATQINAVISVVRATASDFGVAFLPNTTLIIGGIMAVFVCLMVSGGASRIGSAAEMLVPFASVVYILLCLGAIALHVDGVGQAFRDIMLGAFDPRAVTGGAVGSLFTAMRLGVSRGVFSNEAGMGTAAIAHGGANVNHPAQQGMMGIVEVFLDTIVICTMTALVILVSDVPVAYGVTAGAELTASALAGCYGSWVNVLLSLCMCCFALATILGWGFYAGRCIEYLLGSVHWGVFAVLQALVVILGATVKADVIWSISEAINGLMAIPNLIALLLLAPQVRRMTREYDFRLDS